MNPKDWIPSVSRKAAQQPITTIAKSRNWNQFQTERKGMYNARNYGTYQDARAARSRDYQKWKNK
ncbi:MAG: hypothetical protein LBV43_08000 [Prevotella sp.]|nr:hypothetical protein [Prevotella sp.]